jgi:hypothetical protein
VSRRIRGGSAQHRAKRRSGFSSGADRPLGSVAIALEGATGVVRPGGHTSPTRSEEAFLISVDTSKNITSPYLAQKALAMCSDICSRFGLGAHSCYFVSVPMLDDHMPEDLICLIFVNVKKLILVSNSLFVLYLTFLLIRYLRLSYIYITFNCYRFCLLVLFCVNTKN